MLLSGLLVETEGLGRLRLWESSLPWAPPVPWTVGTQSQRGRGDEAPSGAHPQPLRAAAESLSAPDCLLVSWWLPG